MNNKVKRILSLLFVVSTLLLLIGSASAENVDLNENLEASLDLDDGLSVDDSISNQDNKVSNQVAASNIDDETEDTSSINEVLNSENLISDDVVSKNEDTTINTKDSDKDIEAANNLGANSFELQVRCLNNPVKVGDTVSFEIIGISHGDAYQGYIPIDVMYSENEMTYKNYTVGGNVNMPDWYSMAGHIYGPNFEQDWCDHRIFYYNCNDIPFGDGFFFNFTVNFEAKQIGNPGIYTVINVSNNPAVEIRTHVIEEPANFTLENKVLTPMVDVGDTVAFEIFGRNIGGAFTEQYVPIHIQYDEKEMHCIGYKVGENPDVPYIDFTNNYQVDIGFDGTYDAVNVLYDCGGNFANGHCFNFTLYFKVINDENKQPGCHAYMLWNDGDSVEATNTTRISPDSSLEKLLTQESHDASFGDIIGVGPNENIVFTAIANDEFVKPGDSVYFVIYLENTGETGIQCKNNLLSLYDYYPTDGFKFVNYTIDPVSSHPESISVTNPNEGYVQITQKLTNNLFAAHDKLKVVLEFTSLKGGIICNHLFLNDIKEANHIIGSVVSGTPDLNLTKTVHEDKVNIGDSVFFDVVVKNSGDIAFYDHANQLHQLLITDNYPEGLKYVGFTINEITQNGGTVNVTDSGNGVLNITYKFDDEGWHPSTEIRFEPKSIINITLEFKAEECGKWTNNVNIYWKYKDWNEEESLEVSDSDSVVVGDPNFTIEKVASDKEVKVGDMVTFKITYTNTGNINLTGVYITDKDYSDGLVYSDFSDKSLWTFDGKDTWYYNDVLPVGESAVLELTFEATTPGEKTNTAIGGHNITNDTLESNDTVLVKEDETNPLGSSNEEEEEDSDETPENIPEETPDDNPEETPEETNEAAAGADGISGDKVAPVNKVANIPATGNPLFVLLISLLTLCFVSVRDKK